MLKQDIELFLAEKRVGVVGVSRSEAKLGNKVCQKLKSSGYDVHPVHPQMESLDGDSCVSSVRQLPSDVRALMVVAGSDVCVKVLGDVSGTNIRRIWIFSDKKSQPDVEAQIKRLEGVGVSVISGFCPFMFLEPVASVHSIHRFFARLTGKYPK